MKTASRWPFYFDLDGTLIDSADGISTSINFAIEAAGCTSQISDWRPFIGPPLDRMLRQSVPELSDSEVSEIIAAFRKHYDTKGLFETVLFPGVMETLSSLADQGHPIFIATNKPQFAAEAIVQHLQLSPLIRRIVGGDFKGTTGGPRKPSKADRVEILEAEQGLNGGFFVGDGADDFEAADRIGAKFFLATWGYGVAEVLERHCGVDQLETFPTLLERLSVIRND